LVLSSDLLDPIHVVKPHQHTSNSFDTGRTHTRPVQAGTPSQRRWGKPQRIGDLDTSVQLTIESADHPDQSSDRPWFISHAGPSFADE